MVSEQPVLTVEDQTLHGEVTVVDGEHAARRRDDRVAAIAQRPQSNAREGRAVASGAQRLPVRPFAERNRIARLCDVDGVLDAAERHALRAGPSASGPDKPFGGVGADNAHHRTKTPIIRPANRRTLISSLGHFGRNSKPSAAGRSQGHLEETLTKMRNLIRCRTPLSADHAVGGCAVLGWLAVLDVDAA